MQEIDREGKPVGRCVAPNRSALRLMNEPLDPITLYEGPYQGEADA